MADNTDIERTIYKLELDGSAYVDGVNKLTESTTKLTQSQQEANKNLINATTLQIKYKEEIKRTNEELKENEKTVKSLTAANNFLQSSTSPEVRKKALDDLTAATKRTEDLRNKVVQLGTHYNAVTKQVKDYNKETQASTTHQNAAVKSLEKFTSGSHLLAEGVNIARRRVVDFGFGIATGLVGVIIGAAIPSVEKLVESLITWFESLDKGNEALKLLKINQENANEVMDAASKSAAKDIVDLKILYKTATDVTLSIDERRKAVKALQEEFPDYFKNVSAETILNGNAKKSYDALAESILKTAKATAAKAKLDELEAQKLEKDFERQKVINATTRELKTAQTKQFEDIAIAGGQGAITANQARQLEIENITARREARLKELEEQKKLLQNQEDFLIKFAGLTDIAHVIETDDAKKFKKTRQEVENIYAQELQKLKADIAKLDSTGFTNEATITKAIQEDFKIRENAFDKAFKDKQLTATQLESLKGYLKNLEDLTLNAQLESFRKQRQTYLQAITDEINNLQLEESTRRIQALQDSFERERQTILTETDRTISSLRQRKDKEISDIVKNAASVGLTQADVASKIKEIETTYGKLFDDLIAIKNQKLEQLEFDTFERVRDDAKKALDAENLGISQGTLFRIQQESELLHQGKISWAEYQKALTEISKNEAQERFNVQKEFLEQEIKIRQDKLATDGDLTNDQITRLKDEIRKLQQDLADAEKGNIISQNATENKKKTDTLASYADAVGKLADSVIQFWAKANEAETKALDYSIGLQEKRVEAAQRIADHGNAQYLKEETDKLNELNVARENAARKQLGIDAALQASQILVGITGAISKIATPGIGVAETISEIAVIIGALATGYGLVRQLQTNRVQLAEGTEYVSRNGHPRGVDTVPASLTEGEAVIPVETNKAYRSAVSAIYNKTIPADHLNAFVRSYHEIPRPNFERIKEAAELKIGQDTAMIEQNNLLKENTELQKDTIKILKTMGVNVTLDKNGFALSFLEAIEQNQRNKKC